MRAYPGIPGVTKMDCDPRGWNPVGRPAFSTCNIDLDNRVDRAILNCLCYEFGVNVPSDQKCP